MLWDGVSKKIATSRIEFLHTIEDEAIKVLKEMEKTDAADISLLKDLLGTFFDNLRLFNSTRSSSVEKISEESQAQLLTDRSHNLNNAETQEGEKIKDVESLQIKIADIDSREAQLKRELENISAKREDMKSLLLKEEE